MCPALAGGSQPLDRLGSPPRRSLAEWAPLSGKALSAACVEPAGVPLLSCVGLVGLPQAPLSAGELVSGLCLSLLALPAAPKPSAPQALRVGLHPRVLSASFRLRVTRASVLRAPHHGQTQRPAGEVKGRARAEAQPPQWPALRAPATPSHPRAQLPLPKGRCWAHKVQTNSGALTLGRPLPELSRAGLLQPGHDQRGPDLKPWAPSPVTLKALSIMGCLVGAQALSSPPPHDPEVTTGLFVSDTPVCCKQ